MEKIEKVNEILKQDFSIDIFNYNVSDKNDLDKKICEKIDNYFTYKLSLQDIIKSIYGEDAEIVIKEKIEYESPSNIKYIDLDNPDIERILDLRDFGYKVISLDYYVKQGEDENLIYIGSNKESVYKYDEVLTENGFMSRLEQVLNIELNPNTEHAEINYRWKQILPEGYDIYGGVPGFYVPADFENRGSVIDFVNINKAIKTKDGKIIAKSIDCKHFEGYSTDSFKPENVLIDFNFKKNDLTSNLEKVPDEVVKELRKVLKNYFYNNEGEIIKDILVVLKDYMNENIDKSKKMLFKSLETIYNLYPEIVEYSSKLNLVLPLINQEAIEKFKDSNISNHKTFVSKYNEDKDKLESDLNDVNIERDAIQDEIEEILKHTKDCWEEYSSKEFNIFCINDDDFEPINFWNYLDDAYYEFVSFFKQDGNVNLEQISKIREQIESARQELEYARSFDTIYDYDYRTLDDRYLPFDAGEELANAIEKYLNKNSLVEEIINKNKMIKNIKEQLENINGNYEKQNTAYNNLLYYVKRVDEALYNLAYNSEQLLNFSQSLEKIDSIYYIGIKNSIEYKKIWFYIELFSSIIEGNIFYNDLEQNNKVLELLDSKKPIYEDDNYVNLIKKQLTKKMA